MVFLLNIKDEKIMPICKARCKWQTNIPYNKSTLNCVPTKKQNIRQAKKSANNYNEIDFNKPTLIYKIGLYLLIVCGLFVFIGGLDMTFTGSNSFGWSPGGRFISGRQGSISCPVAIFFGLILLSIPIYRQIKKSFKNNKSV